MGTRYLYLEDAPASFKESCDLLNSDDETELPAHSQILARHSSLFADMLVDGPLSRASPLNKACLPLTDCAADTATKMITTLYRCSEATNSSHRRAVQLAHRGAGAQAGHDGIYSCPRRKQLDNPSVYCGRIFKLKFLFPAEHCGDV